MAVFGQDPDHQAPRIEFTSAPEVTETPSQTGKAKAQETADVEVCVRPLQAFKCL